MRYPLLLKMYKTKSRSLFPWKWCFVLDGMKIHEPFFIRWLLSWIWIYPSPSITKYISSAECGSCVSLSPGFSLSSPASKLFVCKKSKKYVFSPFLSSFDNIESVSIMLSILVIMRFRD
jgi:hypothetical protein